MLEPLWKTVWQFPTKLNMISLHKLANRFLDVYPVDFGTDFHTKACTWTFKIALFITAQTWKQSRYTSRNEWINNCYIYTMDYYSAIKVIRS